MIFTYCMKLYLFVIVGLMLTLGACKADKSNTQNAEAENAPGEIVVKYAEGLPQPDTLFVEHSLISELINAKAPEDIKVVYDTIVRKDNAFHIPVTSKGPASYSFRISDVPTSESFFTLYTAPGDNMEIEFTSLSPVTYNAQGTPLIEGMAQIQAAVAPVTLEYSQLMQRDDIDIDKIQGVAQKFVDVHTEFIKKNPDSPAAVFALIEIADDDSFPGIYESLSESAKQSVLFPIVEMQYNNYKEAHQEQEKIFKNVDNMPAPDFSLPGLDGRKISIADYKGKWVILDFWGSWCGWCVRGFPALKEAYNKYHAKGLEVIGINCNDTDADWREAVKKYDLPWIQVFNGDDTQLLENYGIQGFPTKIIVNPQGIIVNVTVGEEPAFFDTLDSLMSE